ncbi:MAG: DUF1800 domain-containing protein [Gemmataceae bacterium]|nr:DUF1800 domain-containing protein [Gemmataceae bacterium]
MMSLALPTSTEPLAPHDFGAAGWTKADAAHLLRRAQYGASAAEMDQAHRAGPAATLDRLCAIQPESAEFIRADDLLRKTALDTGSTANLQAWWLHRMLRSANPLAEKMTFLWHNLFATSNDKVKDVALMLAQNDLFRGQALGDYGKLLHRIARDPAMLIWLDGNANRRRHPNENFAREVMELFSLGVGNYTEKDIQEAARCFTGWHMRDGEFWFNDTQHDTGTKTVLGSTGAFDGDGVIDICLKQPACPRFIAIRLLKTFVQPEPDAATVQALADCIRRHQFQMAPVLRELLGSRLFFSAKSRGCLIKSPLDLVLGAERALVTAPRLEPTARCLEELGQAVFLPPTVKGWEGGRLWISSTTYLLRANFASELAAGTKYGPLMDLDAQAREHQLLNASQAVTHYTGLLLASPPDAAVVARLRAFASDQAAPTTRDRGLLHLILALPEYQLM